MRFEDRVAIITGAAMGIGRSIGRKLASEGGIVIVSDVDAEAARQTAGEIASDFDAKTLPITTDVRNQHEITYLVQSVLEEFGRIDIMVGNAGICPMTSIEDITQKEWDDVLNINLRGVFFCCQAVAPIMKEQGRGGILNMSSVAGKTGGAAVAPHYAISKAGIICLTQAFAKALAPFGVRVNAIAPGPVDTPMVQAFPESVREDYVRNCPLGRLADPEDIAEAAAFLLSDGAKHITGEILDVNGGVFMD